MNGKLNNYLLDTNILIDQLRGYKKITEVINRISTHDDFLLHISTLSELEIFVGKSMSKINSEKEAVELIKNLISIPVTSIIARQAGQIQRIYHTKVIDSVIAATAILNKCTLVTRNIKHFAKIPKLKVLQP